MLGIGLLLGGLMIATSAAPAGAISPPSDGTPAPATAGISASEPGSETSFTPALQTEIQIGEGAMPADFIASPDGAFGYAVSNASNEFVIIDLERNEVVDRIDTPLTGGDELHISPDGTRAYFNVIDGYASRGIGVVDLVNRAFVAHLTDVLKEIQEIVVTGDGGDMYVLNSSGIVARYDLASGVEVARHDFREFNPYALLLTQDDTRLLVGHGRNIYTLDASTLDVLQSITVPEVTAVSDLSVDANEDRVYFSDAGGSWLGVYNPTSNEVVTQVSVGARMGDVVGSDEHDRAFSTVASWDMLMAADFAAGVRSESFREMPAAPFSVSRNPANGDLLVANSGWYNDEPGSTVTVVHRPGVTAPADQPVEALGELVRFEVSTTGIKNTRGGGVVWQASSDGDTWEDIDGATDEQLDVLVSAQSVQQYYRVRWSDDFWGERGVSAAARMVAPAPRLVFDEELPRGIVGEAYPDTVFTATGVADLSWSLVDPTALPAGLELDEHTGTLSGTPQDAGEFHLGVRVTDAFGSDEREYGLRVDVAAAGGPGALPGETPGGEPVPAPAPDEPLGGKNLDGGVAGDARAPQLSATGGAPLGWAAGAAGVIIGLGVLMVLRARLRARKS